MVVLGQHQQKASPRETRNTFVHVVASCTRLYRAGCGMYSLGWCTRHTQKNRKDGDQKLTEAGSQFSSTCNSRKQSCHVSYVQTMLSQAACCETNASAPCVCVCVDACVGHTVSGGWRMPVRTMNR